MSQINIIFCILADFANINILIDYMYNVHCILDSVHVCVFIYFLFHVTYQADWERGEVSALDMLFQISQSYGLKHFYCNFELPTQFPDIVKQKIGHYIKTHFWKKNSGVISTVYMLRQTQHIITTQKTWRQQTNVELMVHNSPRYSKKPDAAKV